MTNVMLNPDAIYFHDKDGTLPVAERYGSRIILENTLNMWRFFVIRSYRAFLSFRKMPESSFNIFFNRKS